MSIAGDIIQVEGIAGSLVSIVNRGGQPKLVNQKITNNETLDKDDIAEIPLNVVISYNVTSSNSKTSNPTQMGVNVNDHIYKNPDEIVINFGVTDFKGTIARLRGLYANFASGWKDYEAGDSISRQMLDTLITAKDKKTLFTVDDGMHKYENLTIDTIEYTRDKKSNKALIATITMTSFIFVQAGKVDGSSVSVPVAYDQTAYKNAIDNLSSINAIAGV